MAEVHALLHHSDPAKVAEGRSFALQAALGVRKSGLMGELEDNCDVVEEWLLRMQQAFTAFLEVGAARVGGCPQTGGCGALLEVHRCTATCSTGNAW